MILLHINEANKIINDRRVIDSVSERSRQIYFYTPVESCALLTVPSYHEIRGNNMRRLIFDFLSYIDDRKRYDSIETGIVHSLEGETMFRNESNRRLFTNTEE